MISSDYPACLTISQYKLRDRKFPNEGMPTWNLNILLFFSRSPPSCLKLSLLIYRHFNRGQLDNQAEDGSATIWPLLEYFWSTLLLSWHAAHKHCFQWDEFNASWSDILSLERNSWHCTWTLIRISSLNPSGIFTFCRSFMSHPLPTITTTSLSHSLY